MDDSTGLKGATLIRSERSRPLAGLTILLVEDSRYASEAVRLICQRSGARLRRADCLRSAHRHLATYRPSLVLVDLGLPDGSGLDLIRELASLGGHAPVVLATSGDDPGLAEVAAMAAGAHGFVAKPLQSIAAFQKLVLGHFPDRAKAQRNIVPFENQVTPDPLAMREDIEHALDLVRDTMLDDGGEMLDYCRQFLTSLAESAGDPGLKSAVAGLKARENDQTGRMMAALLPELKQRIEALSAI